MLNPHQLNRYGSVLIWAGVLVWLPYFILRMTGASPSLWTFLPFHLLGVIGGARMRTSAKKQLGVPVEKRKGYKRVAHYLVIASLLIWVPYYILKITGNPVNLTTFLTVHLIGIFSGSGLMGIGGAVEYLKKRQK